MDIYTDGRVDQCKVDTILDDTIHDAVTILHAALGARLSGSVELALREKLHALTDALVDAADSERRIAEIERA